ncbi:MAG: DnaJ C-terminal domain-containing protein [Pirellulaceae bacterium]
MDEDFYKVLGINRNATADDIQKAYRKLARKYHPDVNPDKNAKEKFQQVQRAYDVLNDPEKREMYDRYGSSFESAGAGPGPGPGGGGWRTQSGSGGFEGFDFTRMFGGGGEAPPFEGPFADIFQQFAAAQEAPPTRRGGRSRRGADLQHELTVPFHSAVKGGEARLVVRRPTGKEETIDVKIPAGVEDGQVIRLRGQGEAGSRNGTPGDLLIRIHVAPHPLFRRKGLDLELDVPVTVAEAALGAKIDIPTPHGIIALKVPPACSSGKRLRLKGQGIHRRDDTRGDLYAVIQIALPATLDPAAVDLIKRLAAEQPYAPRTDLKW